MTESYLPSMKPLRPWRPPPPTTEPLDWITLRSISLLDYDSPDSQVQNRMKADFRNAIFEDGFLTLMDHGLTQDEIAHQFELAQMVLVDDSITPGEKARLRMNTIETGTFAGYKPRALKEISAGVWDNYEEFNYYSEHLRDLEQCPRCMHPYVEDVRGFIKHFRDDIEPRILAILSELLELPPDYLEKNVASKDDYFGEGYYHQMVYHPKRADQLRGAVQFEGHKDFGLVTYLVSQPIAGLQVLCGDRVWRNVKYTPGGIVVNLGEVIEYLSGGVLPATRHRVVDPPLDQAGHPRITLALFSYTKPDIPLAPLRDSPVARNANAGKVLERRTGSTAVGEVLLVVHPPTVEEFRTQRIKRLLDGHTPEIVDINGLPHRREAFGDIIVLEAV